MCDEGKPKTDFTRAVIERAMINGITPAQAAKELYGQRGEARMMSVKKRRALETVSVAENEQHHQAVVSSAQGVNILNNLDEFASELKKRHWLRFV